MRSFLIALGSEAWLACRSSGPRVLVLLASLAATLRILLGHWIGVARTTSDAVFKAGESPVERWTAYAPFIDGLGVGWLTTIVLLLSIVSAGHASDREEGWSRLLLVSGLSRSAQVIARFVVWTLVALLVSSVLLVVAAGIAALFYDFTAVLEDGVEIFTESELRDELFAAIGRVLITLPAVVAFALFVASLARSAAAAVGMTLGASVLFDVFKSFLGDLQSWFYASYHPSLVDTSYLREVGQMARGFSDFEYPDPLNLWVPLPEALLFVAAAVALTRWRKL